MLIVLHGIVDDFCRFLSVFMEFVWHFLWYIAIKPVGVYGFFIG